MLEQSADEVAQTTEVYYNQLLALYEQEKTRQRGENPQRAEGRSVDHGL